MGEYGITVAELRDRLAAMDGEAVVWIEYLDPGAPEGRSIGHVLNTGSPIVGDGVVVVRAMRKSTVRFEGAGLESISRDIEVVRLMLDAGRVSD